MSNNWSKEAVKLHQKGVPVKEIAARFEKAIGAVYFHLRKNGIFGRKLIPYNREYFDEIDCEEKAYWLGFLYADGSITKGPATNVQVAINSRDEPHLSKFTKSLGGPPTMVKFYKKSKFTYCPTGTMAKIVLSSKKMVSSLRNLGFTSTKTIDAVPIKLSNRGLQTAFWRGVFDGDGCIYKGKNGYWNCSICGTKATVEEFCNFVSSPKFSPPKCRKSHPKLYTAQFFGEKAINLARVLYKGSSSHLDRKYRKFLEMS